MSTITNEATLIYSGIKTPDGGMFTAKLVETFEDEESEAKWLEKLIEQVNAAPEEWGVCYSTKRI